ncbi:MAG: alternative ribosome rescue aminoacyl-tRNA hydrolase ArfB [Bacteroidia bacterium]
MHFKPPFLDKEFRLSASRSGGKGGQNVNKLSTKVMLEFNIAASLLLTEKEKEILTEKLFARLNKEGDVQVVAQTERTQMGNRLLAVKKMYALLNKCFVENKKRKATSPSKGSKERRLQSKKMRSAIKNMRSNQLPE